MQSSRENRRTSVSSIPKSCLASHKYHRALRECAETDSLAYYPHLCCLALGIGCSNQKTSLSQLEIHKCNPVIHLKEPALHQASGIQTDRYNLYFLRCNRQRSNCGNKVRTKPSDECR